MAATALIALWSCTTEASGFLGPCPEPALYSAGPARGYFVGIEEKLGDTATTRMFELKYGFRAEYILPFGFGADFSDATREQLRCESLVRYIEGNRLAAPPPS